MRTNQRRLSLVPWLMNLFAFWMSICLHTSTSTKYIAGQCTTGPINQLRGPWDSLDMSPESTAARVASQKKCDMGQFLFSIGVLYDVIFGWSKTLGPGHFQ